MEEDFQLDEKITGLVKKSKKSKVPYGILKKVYNRGMAAWRTGHRPGTTPQQWAFARVNSFLTGGGARKADADLWSKAKVLLRMAKKEELELDEKYDSDKFFGGKGTPLSHYFFWFDASTHMVTETKRN